MSKNVAMFVDVANMYYAARGQDVDVDYVALLKHAAKGRDLIRAYAYTGLDPENENQRKFIDFLGKNGYKPVIKDIRKFGDGRMKANLDIELVVDLFRLADRMDIAVIVSGDGDFAPAIRALQDKGVRCEVISFKPNTSSDLIAVADEFMDIMKIASISRKEGRAIRDGMSAPEMPAKEVSPEFGFRDASPSVAAAALAALKTGVASGSGNGRRTRGGSSRRAAAPAATPAADPTAERTAATAVPIVPAAPAGSTATETMAEGTEEARRRRRRRGGRGRGRSRREDEAAPAAPAAPAVAGGGEEIGWEEFDSLNQLDGADGADENREYTFEEADAATLAELGISPDDLAASAAEADEKPKRRTSTRAKKTDAGDAPAAQADDKPKHRTSTRARKTDAGDAPAAQAEPAEEKPKRRTSTRTGKADAGDAPAAQAGPAEEKPKRRTSTRTGTANAGDAPAAQAGQKPLRTATRTKKADVAAPAEGSDGEPQGIWGRFRSARKPRSTTSS